MQKPYTVLAGRGRRGLRGRLAALAVIVFIATASLLAVSGPAYASRFGTGGLTVTGVSPSNGPVSGGTVVTITGTGFEGLGCPFANPVTDVYFGTVDAGFPRINSDTSMTVTAPAQAAGTVDVTVSIGSFGGGPGSGFCASNPNPPADQYTYGPTVPACPAGTSANFRWHYSANGSAGSWSGTQTARCPGSLTMGPQAMEGNLQVTPGTTLEAGYDFTLPGNKAALTLTVSNAQVVFQVSCVSGATPSASTFTVTMSAQSYSVTNDEWYPSGDQSSPLVYQGSTAVPNLCGGGQLDLAQGGTFSATLS